MNDFFLPQRAFFTVNYRCPFTDPGPKIDGNLREWNSMMLLPNIAGIDGQKPYANCYLCWNNDGVYFGVEVNNKTNYNLSPSDPTKGDCVQLFIDTRDVKTQRANRYCHRFYFLPGGIGKTTKTPFGRQIAINNAQEQSPPCSEDSIKARVRILKKSYQMEVKLPANGLNGFNPREFSRIGFTYLINDTEHGIQSWSAIPDMGVEHRPSTWGTAELFKNSK
jgi:hypothetical protein